MQGDLVQRLAALSAVPPATAEAYHAAGPRLIAAVDRSLETRGDRARLIGDNALGTAFDNHANHWRFMSNVFRLNSIELLAKVLPWVYSAYTARGFSLDYFLFVVDTYREAVINELGEDLAAPIAAVYARVREQHELIAALADAEPGAVPMEATWLGRMMDFCEVLLAGDVRRALALTEEWVREQKDVSDFFQLVVTGAMIEIGHRWERGQISVAEEHLASSLVNRVMASLYPKVVQTAPWRGRAVVTCVVNEYHELGSRMFADLLELDGWDVRYLGTNTPVADLVALVEAHPVRVLALSVAMPFNLTEAATAIKELRRLGAAAPKILLGGRALSLAPNLWQEIGGDAYCPTAECGVERARSWSKGIW